MNMCLLLKSMKKKLCIVSILLLTSIASAYAQQLNSTIQSFLSENQKSFGLTERDVTSWMISNQYVDQRYGVQHVYIQQQHLKIPVFNAIASIVIRNGKAYGLTPPFVQDLASKVNSSQPSISTQQAIQAALSHLDLPSVSINSPTKVDNENKKFTYELPAIASSPVKVELVYLPSTKGVNLAWDVSIDLKNGKHWWNVRIDASNGSYLEKNDWVVSCNWDAPHDHAIHTEFLSPQPQPLPTPGTGTAQYNVFPLPIESPIHGTRSLLNDPSDLIASPYGWHDTNGAAGTEYNITRGNNVYAYEDANADNLPGYSPDGGALQVFNHLFHIDSSTTYNRDASLTNLFYMNNMLHDLLYQNGFNETQGNFQENNYGNGGLGNDHVFAEGLDGGGTNNANFATPSDGSNPRMQMFLWSGSTPSNCVTFNVNTPPVIAGLKSIATASYNPASAFNITADMILANDGAGVNVADGCEAFVNAAAVAGKIVIVDRGNCSFFIKTQNAQLAGALAIVIANNVSGTTPPAMSGTPTMTITIPTVSVTQTVGNDIKTQLGLDVVNASLNICLPPPNRDGSFDNGIVAHEYGHGVSNRLTGGPAASSCLQNAEQGGEGWSDWLGLITTIEPGDSGAMGRGIGTFALFQPTTGQGIRRYRYSTDMSINPQTYADLATSASAHPRGEIWCDAIWDMTWFLIRDFGFNPNLYSGNAGNNIAFNLVLKGMALQPCSPGYIDARNAILLADDIYYGNAHRCQIWEAFARRGMGYNASQGSSSAVGDETVDFTYPTFCLNPTIPPSAAFTSNQTTAACPASIQFTDASTNIPQSWLWNFGDGQTSTQQNPLHAYSQPGSYTVKLVVTNTLGSDSLTQTNYITVTTFSLTISATPPSICAGDSVQLSASPNGSLVISGYNVVPTTYAPTIGTGTNVALTDDVVSGVLPIGFNFNFYGNSYSNFYISSNGFIGFSPGTPNGCCQGQNIPNASAPNNLVAFAFNDLNPAVNSSVVNYFTTGSAPNRKLVVNYQTYHYNGTAYPMKGQIVLIENDNSIELHTDSIVSPAGNVTTQGIENANGTLATTPAGRNAAVFTVYNDAVRFTPYSNYNYSWAPSSNMNNSAISNPKAAPTSTTNFNVVVTDPNGCTSAQTVNVIVTVCGPGSGLNLRAFIEGLKSGPGVMTPVLYNTGESTNPLDCDSITIELHNATTPFALVYSVDALLNINGYASANFPVGALGNSYYIVVRTRNGIETWSKLPVLMSASTVFDLTTP